MIDDLTVQLLRKREFFSHDLFHYAAETAVEGPSCWLAPTPKSSR